MPAKYAAQTTVDVSKTQKEIEALLKRYHADQFLYGWEETRAVIGFRIGQLSIRIYLPLPQPDDQEITFDNAGRRRVAEAARTALDQANRSRWRALLLVIKAKLEAISAGISTIEREFLADTVMQNGQTIAEWAGPQLQRMYGNIPPLLPSAKENTE